MVNDSKSVLVCYKVCSIINNNFNVSYQNVYSYSL